MNCFYWNTFYSVLTFLYFYTITNFYFHLHQYCYDYFCYYCFCHFHCHYYSFIFNDFNFDFSSFTILFYLCIYRIFLDFKQMTWPKHCTKLALYKDIEAVSVYLMVSLNTVCLTYSSDDLLLKWHCYVLPLTIIYFIL